MANFAEKSDQAATAHQRVEALFETALSAHQLRAYVASNPTYCGDWEDFDPATPDRGTFHLLDTGACEIHSEVLDAPVRLAAGDLVMFPRGDAHRLRGVTGTPGNGFTEMLCAEFEFVTGLRNPVIAALPRCLVVRADQAGEAFRSLAQLLAAEARRRAFGSRVVMDKLCDAIFVLALRSYVTSNQAPRGLLAALTDAKLSRALQAIHGEPARDWTVAELAERALMSRTIFAERFHEVVGQSPIAYLTQWRMTEALRRLQDPRQSAAAIAAALGYRTEAAFRRCFKRIYGFGPGAVRRAAARAVESAADAVLR